MAATRRSTARPPRRSWADLTSKQRAALVALASVQLSHAATAWTDLARRPAREVNGPKTLWALAIAVNFVGPVAYLLWGRRR